MLVVKKWRLSCLVLKRLLLYQLMNSGEFTLNINPGRLYGNRRPRPLTPVWLWCRGRCRHTQPEPRRGSCGFLFPALRVCRSPGGGGTGIAAAAGAGWLRRPALPPRPSAQWLRGHTSAVQHAWLSQALRETQLAASGLCQRRAALHGLGSRARSSRRAR